MKTRFIILTLLIFSFININATITLPSIFSDGMVLQQKSNVAVWGNAKIGQTIQIKTSWSNNVYTIKSNENGQWKTRVSTPSAGGPYNIEFKCNGEVVILKNVLIGEVWICSGQSNMEVMMKNVINFENESKDANYPAIRFFKVPKKSSITQVKDVEAAWQSPSNETVMSYGAVAFFFARNLYKQLNVPVGIIHTSYGSSTQEAWLSEENIAGVTYAEKILSDAKAGKLDTKFKEQKVPTGLYYAMFKPLVPFTVKGVCWYQGEGNAQYPDYFIMNFC